MYDCNRDIPQVLVKIKLGSFTCKRPAGRLYVGINALPLTYRILTIHVAAVVSVI